MPLQDSDSRSLCQLSSKRVKDNWHSDPLSSTKQRLKVTMPVVL